MCGLPGASLVRQNDVVAAGEAWYLFSPALSDATEPGDQQNRRCGWFPVKLVVQGDSLRLQGWHAAPLLKIPRRTSISLI
jgi:hypothetical protein